jgi:hypothetical protein
MDDHVEAIGMVPPVEENFARLQVGFLHVWFEPVRREIAFGSHLDPPDQPQHLNGTPAIEGQQDRMQRQDGIKLLVKTIDDENDVAADRRGPQRNHRLHAERGQDER